MPAVLLLLLFTLLHQLVGHLLLGAPQDQLPPLVAGNVLPEGEEPSGGQSRRGLWNFFLLGALIVLDDHVLDLAVVKLIDCPVHPASAPHEIEIPDIDQHPRLQFPHSK